MQISTEIDFDLDIDDLVREIAEEVMEYNACDYMVQDDVQCLIDESNQDVSDLIDITNGLVTDLGSTDAQVSMQATHVNRIYKRLQYLENRELYSLRSRLGRLFCRLRDIHWYSPWIGPRR